MGDHVAGDRRAAAAFSLIWKCIDRSQQGSVVIQAPVVNSLLYREFQHTFALLEG